jgi:nucleoside 2-deoxyribosyltransferase
MKIYFAGPLFTPYVRRFISEHAQILRENNIEPFVPHESFELNVAPEVVESLLEQGLLQQEDLEEQSASDLAIELLRRGKLSREQLGLPPRSAEFIFEKDYEGLSNANAVVALLDGTQVDDGTACEIGIFYGLLRNDPSKKGIAGFMTDSRGLRRIEHGYGLNLFVLGVIEECGKVFNDFDELVNQLKAWDAELRTDR